jgi:ParB/Sulfiredoxin domain
MNIQPTFTDIRSHLSYQFFTLRTDARREAFWAKLMGKNTELATFPEQAPEKGPNRRFTGTADIPVAQIVGTLNRQCDFDNKFRPLNKHLRERWVDVHLTLARGGWEPILVHKVGENYYVEDGHHRVSIAQALGMTFLPARVWEYPGEVKQAKQCQPEPCPERSSATVYAGVTE